MRHYSLDWYSIPPAERSARGYWHARPFSIEHSGCKFTSNVRACVQETWNVTVWPIEELLARADYCPEQAQRIRKLNRYGKPEAATCVEFERWPDGR